jgi:hypothetical protein
MSKSPVRSAQADVAALRVAYAAAAGAMAAAGTAHAGIIYSGEQNLNVAQFTSLNLNLDGDAYGDLLLKNYVFGGGNYQGATVNFFPGKLVSFNAGPSGFAYVSALNAGFVIDSSSVGPSFTGSMAYGSSNPNAQFNTASNTFLGLSFAGASGTLYGWVRVSVNNAAGTFVVHDWAYDSTGAGIAAGAVPAPGTLGLLAVGASGLGLIRGRKRVA